MGDDDLREPLHNYFRHVYNRHILRTDLAHVKQQIQQQQLRILVAGNPSLTRPFLQQLPLVKDDGNGGRRFWSDESIDLDIWREWRLPDLAIPVIIHDSTSANCNNHGCQETIKEFLDCKLTAPIDAVWYFFDSAHAYYDDGGILEMLNGCYGDELTLLLIIVRNDAAEEGVLLLRRISGGERRRGKLEASMVRLNSLRELDVDDGGILRRLLKRTETAVTEGIIVKRRWEWAEMQAAEMGVDGKVESSVALIGWKQMWLGLATFFVGLIPVAHEWLLMAALGGVTRGLSEIWVASDDLQEAMARTFLDRERRAAGRRNCVRLLLAVAIAGLSSLYVFLSLSYATPAPGTSRSWLAVLLSGFAFSLNSVSASLLVLWLEFTSNLLMSYSLTVIGAIVYVRGSSDNLSDVDYDQLCVDFLSSGLGGGILAGIGKRSWPMNMVRRCVRPLIDGYVQEMVVGVPESVKKNRGGRQKRKRMRRLTVV